jgi:hypothetical protein
MLLIFIFCMQRKWFLHVKHVVLSNLQSKIHVITNLVLMGKVIIFSHTDLWPGYNDLDTSVMSMITNGIHHITKTTLYSRIIIIWYQHVCSIQQQSVNQCCWYLFFVCKGNDFYMWNMLYFQTCKVFDFVLILFTNEHDHKWHTSYH